LWKWWKNRSHVAHLACQAINNAKKRLALQVRERAGVRPEGLSPQNVISVVD
jgi:hypothetical protein